MQICKQSAKQTKADCIRTHRAANDVSYKTYDKRGYNRLGGIAVNRKKYKKNQQQVKLDIQTRQYACLLNGDNQNKNTKAKPPHLNILHRCLFATRHK